MKRHFLATVLMAFAAVVTTTAQNVSTSVQKKHVLIEDFTGIHCGNCPDADVYQERLILAQEGKVNVICVHAGSYATAGIGEPNYITPVSTEIHNYFKISSYPSALVNRTEISGGKIIGRSNLATCSRIETANDALVNVWVSSKFDNTTGKITADVELYYTGDIADNGSALCVSLLQNKMIGQQSGGGANADEYEHNHVLRAMLTPTWGDTIATSGKGTLVKRHYEYRLPAYIGTEATDPLHSDVIAYVINSDTREVYNSELCHVSCEGMEYEMNAILEPYKIEPQRNFGFNFYDCYLINDGNEPITSANFNVTLNDSVMQSAWTGSIAPQERGYIRVPVDFSKQFKGSNEYSIKLTGINGKEFNGGTLKGEFSELITVNDTIVVKLKTDNYVSDNTFRILDADGNVVKELGPYQAEKLYTDTIVLPGKGFYCYEVTDAYGDGITRPRGYIYWYNSLGKQVAANSDIAFHGYRIFFNYGDELPEAPEKPVDPVNPGGDDDEPITPIIPDDPNDPELKGSLWGQDGEYGLKVMPSGTNQYATEMKMGADGTLWWFVYNPASTSEDEIKTTTYNMYLQGVDKFGNKKFNGVGKLISSYPNRSWTQVGEYLCCNSDGSVTVCIRDCRNTGPQGQVSLTGYRFRADGTSMWAEDGVCLDEGMNHAVACGVTMCELTNGDNVFTWMRSSNDAGQPFYIERCRVTKDGVKADKLDDTRIGTSTTFYQYPYIVASDDNSYILIYGLTQSLNLYAKKYDLNHKELWNAGARGLKIYAGGWGSVNALQTRMKVQSDGEGGALIAWNDDRNGDGYYAAYLCWIKPDGSYGFTNEDGGHDIRFTYTEMSQDAPDVIRTTDGKGFIAILSEFAQGSQSWQDLVIQKLDNEGNRPWGDDGIFIEDLQNVESISYANIEPGNPGQFVIAYQKYRSVYDVTNYYGILSEKDGSIILGDTIIEMSPVGHDRSRMEMVSNPTEKYWVMHWRDGGANKDNKIETHCLARVNFSGNIINWIYNPEPEFTPGDANNDGSINVGDYTVVANYILADEAPAVADVNGDGFVDVGDLTAIANIILYSEAETPASAKPRNATDPSVFENLIYIKDATAEAGQEIEIPVYMKNSVGMTGFQFDIVMPEGLSVAMEDDYYLIDLSTERTTARNTNTFDSAKQKDGSVRVLAGSTKSKTIEGNDGEVAIITANVAAGLADGEYKVVLKNIIMSDATGKTYKVETSEATISVGAVTNINKVNTTGVVKGKYTDNGRLIIIKNGKKYGIEGLSIK